MIRYVFATDTHGDLVDHAARDALLEFVEIFQPEERIHGGDAWDFRALRKNATVEEQAEGIMNDYEVGLTLLKAYKPTRFLLGNHDNRLWEKAAVCADGKLREYCRMLVSRIEEEMDAIGCELFPYDIEDGVYRLGDRKFVHGYCHSLHSAHQAGTVYGNITFGHVHTFDRAAPVRDDKPVAWSCGHLMDARRATYARRRHATLRWQQGFIYGWVDDEGHVTTHTVEPVGGRWILPRSFG